jgi:hypothetical protein
MARMEGAVVNHPQGTVRILKLAAAQRQLDAAIRMTFLDEDSIAITTVAGAAHRILRDLKEKRGQKVFADQWRDSMLGVARALVRGELPDTDIQRFRDDSQMWPVISMLADQIRAVGAYKTIVDLRAIVDVHVPASMEKKYWGELNEASNFLKHADRDPDKSFAENDLNSYQLIFGACNIYFDLMGRLTPEMQVWSAYNLINANMETPLTHPLGDIASAFKRIEVLHRKRAGVELIALQKKQGM